LATTCALACEPAPAGCDDRKVPASLTASSAAGSLASCESATAASRVRYTVERRMSFWAVRNGCNCCNMESA
jgi:hypothetical protein